MAVDDGGRLLLQEESVNGIRLEMHVFQEVDSHAPGNGDGLDFMAQSD